MEKVLAKKNESIQVLRGLLFLVVFFGHACGELSISNIFINLHMSVTPFFVLSGFLLMFRDSQEDSVFSLKECFKSMTKRISRLYPLHILTTLFCFLIWTVRYFHGGVLMERIKEMLIAFFLHSILLQSWIPIEKVIIKLNAPSWYIATAAFLYFMYPVIRKLVCKYNKWALLFMMVILRVTWAAFVMVLGEKYDFDFFS
ncbi:MAG: acyltransferase family protein, partial [Treponema sp.]|nr:acyltransferase family protein [Treponema sp.]